MASVVNCGLPVTSKVPPTFTRRGNVACISDVLRMAMLPWTVHTWQKTLRSLSRNEGPTRRRLVSCSQKR